MTKKDKEKAAAVILLLSGLGLCIAGIFMPPLLVLGGGLLAGALAVISNILQDKDRITVNNNYIVSPPVKEREASPALPELAVKTPAQKIKSFFGFKNKKYMDHHNEVERLLHESPEDAHLEEHESNSMQLPMDLLNDLNRLNDAFNSIDMELIAKVARQFNEKAHGAQHDNESSSLR